MMLSDEELLELMNDPESDRVERKASVSERKKIRQAICALANDMPGYGKPGVIFVGLNDDGSCSRLNITDELLLTLADMRSNGNILPPPVMRVFRKSLQGCELAVVEVEPSGAPPVRFDGRPWIRVGPRRATATEQEEKILAEKRRWRDLPFDQQPVGARLEDLDLRLFEREYLPAAVAPDVLAENKRSTEHQLAALRLLTRDGQPNVTATLLFAADPRAWVPGAYLQFVRFDGAGLTDPIKDEKELTGPLVELLRRLDELLKINIATAIDVTSGSRELRQPDYPLVALQQLLRNAVMHRTYESSNAPVRCYWFSDRVEVHSPGGLFGQVTPENFGHLGITDYRNPLLAEALRVLGFVQRFGMGIPLAKRALEQNGNPPPEFHPEPRYLLATIRRRS